jgi:hypothetical protein
MRECSILATAPYSRNHAVFSQLRSQPFVVSTIADSNEFADSADSNEGGSTVEEQPDCPDSVGPRGIGGI